MSRFVLGVTTANDGDVEPMRAGDQFAPLDHSPVAFRIVSLVTGEPVEPGARGVVTVPASGDYRIELL